MVAMVPEWEMVSFQGFRRSWESSRGRPAVRRGFLGGTFRRLAAKQRARWWWERKVAKAEGKERVRGAWVSKERSTRSRLYVWQEKREARRRDGGDGRDMGRKGSSQHEKRRAGRPKVKRRWVSIQ